MIYCDWGEMKYLSSSFIILYNLITHFLLLAKLSINTILFLIGMTAEDLENSIESWLKTKYNLEVDYSAAAPVKQLEDLGLLSRDVVGRMIKFLDGIRI